MKVITHSHFAGLALLVLLPLCLLAQRHGRGDAIQNYVRGAHPLNAELALDMETTHKWIYFCLTNLRKMKRTTVRVVNPVTHATTSYEGVRLSDLVPGGLTQYRFEVFRESWAFRDKRVLSSDDLSPDAGAVVAYTVNGKQLSGDDPYVFVASSEQGRTLVVSKLAHIKLADNRAKR